MSKSLSILLMIAVMGPCNLVLAEDPPEIPKISEFMVHYRSGEQTQSAMSLAGAQRAMDVSARLGESLAHVRATKEGHQVLRAGRKLTREEAWRLAEQLLADPNVEYAAPMFPDDNLRPPAQPPVPVGGPPARQRLSR